MGVELHEPRRERPSIRAQLHLDRSRHKFRRHQRQSPFGSGGTEQNTNQHLTGLLQQAGISWKSYQEDIDLNTSTGAVLPQNQWTVPLNNISGTFSSGHNPYNGSLAI